MKRVLLIGIILAILILAMPQGVSAATNTPLTILATVPQSIEFVPTWTATSWPLSFVSPGPTTTTDSDALHFVVTSNAPWAVTAADTDATNTNGHMAPYVGTAYGTPVLVNELKVGGIAHLTNTGILLHSDTATGVTTFDEPLAQTLVSSDSSVPGYRIVLTFNCVPNP
jgi:hypothetical protein